MLQFAQLESHFTLHEIVLCLHRHPFAGRHADCTSNRRSHTGESYDIASHATCGKADDERHVGDETITQPENTRAGRATGKSAMVWMIFVFGAR